MTDEETISVKEKHMENNIEETTQPSGRKNRTIPELSEAASAVLDQFGALSATDRTQFMVAASEKIRSDSSAASRAIETEFKEGDEVIVRSGDAKAIGQAGRVVEARRVRLFVELADTGRTVYLFTSDVEKLESVDSESTNDETDAVEATG